LLSIFQQPILSAETAGNSDPKSFDQYQEVAVRAVAAATSGGEPAEAAVTYEEVAPDVLEPESSYVEIHLLQQQEILDRLRMPRSAISTDGPKLGEGVSGAVYRGEVGGKVVAIKLLNDHTEANVAELQQEATIMSTFDHQNVVKIIGVCLE
jgi:hypothetical protein